MTDAAERLRRRYPKSRIPRPLLVGLISVGVVLGLTWLVWTALLHSRPAVAAHVQSFRIDSDTSVSVTLTVERPDPSVPATCRVLAQAADYQPVGEQPVSGGRASEKGAVGEVEEIAGGRSKRLSLNLSKGHYALICNLPGHYAAGMRADFTVK